MEDDLFPIKYLNIVYKGKEFSGKWEDIFCSPEYKEFDGITYVSSPGFFFEFAKYFQRVELIIGIDKSEPSLQFDPIEGAELFQKLDPEIQKRVASGNIDIRYAKDKAIHSKLYLLKGSDGKVGRVIIGSANFTQSALRENRQFEELIVYDRSDSPKECDAYEKRYKEIYRNTIDYIPERIKEKFRMGLPIVIDEETGINIVQDDAGNLLRSDADFIHQSIEDEKKEIDYKVKEVENKEQLFKALSKKTDQGYEFKQPRNGLNKEVRDVIVKRYIDSAEPVSPAHTTIEKELFYTDEDHVLIVKDHDGSTTPLPKALDKEELIQDIAKLNKVIDAYARFVKGSNEEKIKNKKRVFEIILYAFMSPFIWKLREDYSEIRKGKEVKADIPIFLIISGASKTGKTSLLDTINILLGSYKEFENYSKKTGYTIKGRFHFEDLYPILVDEVPKDFFSKKGSLNTGRGQEFIIQEGNTLGNLKGQKYPAVIMTTNEDVDSIAERLLRRVYNIKLEKQFDSDKKADAEDHKSEIKNELHDDLFKDFSWRMIQKIKNGSINFKLESNDFLQYGRDIFQEWFNEIGQQPYDWYNENRVDSYYEQGSKRWHDLFLIERKHFIVKGDVILLNNDKAFAQRSDVDPYINYLASGILKDNNKKILSLDKKEFFKFIGVSEGDGLLKRVWSKLKSARVE